MVLLIDSEPKVSKAHPVTDYGGECKYVAALILNWDEVVAEADRFPGSVASMIRKFVREDITPTQWQPAKYSEPRWVIQGNGLAQWARVIEEESDV